MTHRTLAFPRRSVAAAILITLCVFTLASVATARMYNGFRKIADTDLRLSELAGQVTHLDEVLTMSARMAVATADEKWEQRYRRFEQALDRAIKESVLLAPHAYETEGAKATDAANLKLVEMETRAFELLAHGKQQEAAALLFSPEYEAQKEVYARGMNQTMAILKMDATARANAYRRDISISGVMGGLMLIILAVCWGRVIFALRHYLAAHGNMLAELQKANETLELRVMERTEDLNNSLAELREAQRNVVRTARSAGMAEVAVGVLHNVGNVLNSVNVSAQLVADEIRGSRIENLQKATQLLDAEKADMAAFFDSDRGQALPNYLVAVAGHAAGAQNRALAELASLQNSVDHIKTIVATQQSYAKTAAHIETFRIEALVDMALNLSQVSNGKHGIEVTQTFDAALPSMSTDKHKVMQILLNILSNARHAVRDYKDGPRKIEVVAARHGSDALRLEVRDSGIGISPEAMKEMFRHGYTTKRDGHGFGLHSSANAARELGGEIRCDSAGIGKGSTFVLEIPMVMERSNAHAA